MFKGYKKETAPTEYEDDTLTNNVAHLRDEIVGHKIVSADYELVFHSGCGTEKAFVITLDNGKKVALHDTDDCCAYTELKTFFLHPDKIDHVITGVGTTGDFDTWHIYADMGDVLELTVGWSEGSGYYGYGFNIEVQDI